MLLPIFKSNTSLFIFVIKFASGFKCVILFQFSCPRSHLWYLSHSRINEFLNNSEINFDNLVFPTPESPVMAIVLIDDNIIKYFKSNKLNCN